MEKRETITIYETDKYFIGVMLIKEVKGLKELIELEEKIMQDPEQNMLTSDEIEEYKNSMEEYKHCIERCKRIAKDLGVRI